MVINIDDENEILKKCDFDYFYDSVCSRELCCFYNDIFRIKDKNYCKKDALIDLGRIAITLNRLYAENRKLKKEINK